MFEYECMEHPELTAGDFYVTSTQLLKNGAGRAERSPDGNLILYHQKNSDGFYDCFVMDTTGGNETCLTCHFPEFINRHTGQPSWHPSGEYITFQAEKSDYYLNNHHAMAHPGIGFNNDVYIMAADGSKLWQVTSLATKQKFSDKTPFTGILHPHFNTAGDQISWAQRIGKGGEWGEWALVLADFHVIEGVPTVSNITQHQPGEQHLYYETNDYSQDDSKLIICGNLSAGQREIGMDLFLYDIEQQELIPLTDSKDDWDESGHYSPDEGKIVYISSEGYSPQKGRKWYKWGKAEFWIMETNGTKKYPITGYNCPDSTDFMGQRVMPAYVTWFDQLTLLASIVVEEKEGLTDQLWLIKLAVY